MTLVIAQIPEVPIIEEWEWLTDLLVSYDGSEQRVAVRGSVPRVSQKATYLFTTRNTAAVFANTLLTALNAVWLPEWQYSVKTSAQTSSGASRLYFEPSHTDIRVGEHVIVGNEVFEVTTVHSDGATVTPAMSATIPKGYRIAPVSIAILDDNSGFNRYAVNEVLESSLVGTYNRARTTLTRPGDSSPLTSYSSTPVLTLRPLADENVSDRITTSQIVIDNKISAISLIDKWDYPRIGGPRQFMVQRTPLSGSCTPDTTENMDWWRWFLAHCRGSQRKFWMPTFRNDLTWVSGTGTSLVVDEPEYALTVWPDVPTHRQLQITYSDGSVHRCNVTVASPSGGNSALTISPTRPAGTIAEISYLLPMRLASDKVEWEHHGLYSMLNLNVRTAE